MSTHTKLVTDKIKVGAMYRFPEQFTGHAKMPDGRYVKIYPYKTPAMKACRHDDGLLYFQWPCELNGKTEFLNVYIQPDVLDLITEEAN